MTSPPVAAPIYVASARAPRPTSIRRLTSTDATSDLHVTSHFGYNHAIGGAWSYYHLITSVLIAHRFSINPVLPILLLVFIDHTSLNVHIPIAPNSTYFPRSHCRTDCVWLNVSIRHWLRKVFWPPSHRSITYYWPLQFIHQRGVGIKKCINHTRTHTHIHTDNQKRFVRTSTQSYGTLSRWVISQWQLMTVNQTNRITSEPFKIDKSINGINMKLGTPF